jgi:hypothetical protein
MWQKLASEMGMPWRSAESMHWQLGKQEMSNRANAPIFQLYYSTTGIPSPPSSHPAILYFMPANIPQRQTPGQYHHPHPLRYQPQLHLPHLYHQCSNSGSTPNQCCSDGLRSRSSLSLQLGLQLPMLQPVSEGDSSGSSRTALVLETGKRDRKSVGFMKL